MGMKCKSSSKASKALESCSKDHCSKANDALPSASVQVQAETSSRDDMGFQPLFCSKYSCKSKCECASSHCHSQMSACYKDKDCKKSYECLEKCSCHDLICALKCKSSSKASKALESCSKDHCKSDETTVV